MPDKISNRGKQWLDFSDIVLKHIENYTVPQYGDYPNDYVEEWSPEECILALGKYLKRFGKNSRKDNDGLDMLKVAHFAQLIYDKLDYSWWEKRNV